MVNRLTNYIEEKKTGLKNVLVVIVEFSLYSRLVINIIFVKLRLHHSPPVNEGLSPSVSTMRYRVASGIMEGNQTISTIKLEPAPFF